MSTWIYRLNTTDKAVVQAVACRGGGGEGGGEKLVGVNFKNRAFKGPALPMHYRGVGRIFGGGGGGAEICQRS